MAESNSGLLIAALVAIVAVVGLVILFKGDSTGNAFIDIGESMSYQASAPVAGVDAYEWGMGFGEQITHHCSTVATDQYKCCGTQCSNICNGDQDCRRGCKNVCEANVRASASIY